MHTTTSDELTARARILRAAIDQFAQLGFHGTTMRSVAADAGVSAALVVHYFASKRGLRQECDQRVIRFIDGKRADDSGADVLADAAHRFGPYIARMLSDPGESADALFELLLSVARTSVEGGIEQGSMRASADRDAQAAALVALAVAPFFLAHQLARWSGQDAEAGIRRIAAPIADIYAHGLMIPSERRAN